MTERVVAELSGVVLDVYVREGLRVGDDEVLLLMESMKMEIPVPSGARGRVAAVRVVPGQRVRRGDVLAVVECVAEPATFPAAQNTEQQVWLPIDDARMS